MQNTFRLKSNNMFDRKEEDEQEAPLRIVFLSVEGNNTEIQYFDYIEKYRKKIGIKKGVHIHPLKRAKNDNHSAPEDVLELLEEYVELRESKDLPKRLLDSIPKNYSYDFVKNYLNNEFQKDDPKIKEFEILLYEVGIDLAYNFFLKEYKGKNDVFGIVMDRDYKSHSVRQMRKIVSECKEKQYRCFVTTPLFEFWLLLHLVDFTSENKIDLDKVLLNDAVSKKHTYTSKKVSELAGHSKKISEEKFIKYYLPNIEFAIQQAKNSFCITLEELIGDDISEEAKRGKLGTNIPELFELMREV